MKNQFRVLFGNTNELILVTGIISILLILFTPISARVLDFLLLANLAAALLVLLTTFYTEKPLGFSTFPSLLLVTTLFRLSLNISATRLILDHANAGKVIDAIGTYVVGGNYVTGLVVFLILIVIQYVVVTNGAQRVAEVAARFTLDSLPGKQMSIDADLNMGIIDHEEAKRRRALLEKESNFYGAMDGASKFVKGDAIAGIIIIFINIIGGLSVGIVQKNMSWADALHRYTLLTVGDGIVTQIPSLVIAIATGIIITRAATDSRLGQEIAKQFSAHPKSLMIVSVALMAFALLPGMPLLPIILLVAILLVLTWFAMRKQSLSKGDSAGEKAEANESQDAPDENLYQAMVSQPLVLDVGHTLFSSYQNKLEDLESRFKSLRKQFADECGFVVPQAVIKVNTRLEAKTYSILIHNAEVASGGLEPELLLAIHGQAKKIELDGISTREPTYGLPATWIAQEKRMQAKAAGYTIVDPETVLLTHLQETLRKFASDFLTRMETERLIDARKKEIGSLIEELIPNILTYSDVQRVFQCLLREQISLKNIEAILEVLVDAGRNIKQPEELAERVREKLSASICDRLKDNKNQLHVITLAPELERTLLTNFRQKESAAGLLSPIEAELLVNRLARECEKLLTANVQPVLLCAAPIRRALRLFTYRALPLLNVISINEISQHVKVISASIIDFDKNSNGQAA